MNAPVLLVVAHGTRNPKGVETVAQLAEAARRSVDDVRVAFVDVLGPSPSDVLRELPPNTPIVVVPAFLASGYHVHTDVPREVCVGGQDSVFVTDALGPDPALAAVLGARVRESGWRQGDTVILAAAGSSDDRALADVEVAARQLAEDLGSVVSIAYIATGAPRVPCVVAAARINGSAGSDTRGRVVIASYLLAPGLFHTRLHKCGAHAVTEPLGVDPAVVDLLVARYRSGAAATASVSAGSRSTRS